MTLRHYPHADLIELIDRLEPKLTLAEAVEAKKWLREWKAMLQ